MPSIDLYFNATCPHARTAYITAKHLGLDVNVKHTEFGPNGTRKPEYIKLNPTHTLPTLVDGNFVLFESRAVIKYLASKYDKSHQLYPDTPEGRANVDKIIFFDVTSSFPAIRTVLFQSRAGKESTTEQLDDVKEKLSILSQLLGDKKFFAGDHATIADISVGVSYPYIGKYMGQFALPELDAWYQRLTQAIPVLKQINDEGVAAFEASLNKN